ncbi:MAG: hypothetical protein EOP48_20480, partial [Sphingobacteriales bacterium]
MLKLCSTFIPVLCSILISCGDGDKKASQEGDGKKSTDSIPVSNTRNILFFGNSLTAGYGLDVTEAFPALIQQKIDSLDLPYKVINAGLSGETSAAGESRIDWILKQPVAIFVLELGANDGLVSNACLLLGIAAGGASG